MNNFIVKPNKTVAELIQYKEQCRINKIRDEDMKKNPQNYFKWRNPLHYKPPTPNESELNDYLSFIDQ